MPAVRETHIQFARVDGGAPATLRIALLPRDRADAIPPLLVDDRGFEGADPSVASIQLLEGAEYRYEWTIPEPAYAITCEPLEVFQPDSSDGRTGRLRPGVYTGSLGVQLVHGKNIYGPVDVEVRSRKLNYLSEYRWMLRDIADEMTELVMERFGASSAHFTVNASRDAVTLYERFAFLRALILDERFKLALSEIRRRPHVAWIERHHHQTVGQGLRANSMAARQLARRTPRTSWAHAHLRSVPLMVDQARTEATRDSTPNRFVKFALEHWRAVVADIESALVSSNTSFSRRALRETGEVLNQLDEALSDELFRELGPLGRFPGDDQVLQRREGYRETFRAYMDFEVAALLSWEGGADVYRAGQKDVATLYEYWAFLQLSKAIADLLGVSLNFASLFEVREHGLNLSLRAGRASVITGEVQRGGRLLSVTLWFNRTFGPGTPDGSWTKPMRPDFSVQISPSGREPAIFEPVILHFDAKYRVELFKELFDGGSDDGDPINVQASARRDDLLKMHAYRDAIRRSAGAYVLYPGSDGRPPFQQYHEILPGLGAFALRPSESGATTGLVVLRGFIDAVLSHVASQATQHERGRYWVRESYSEYHPYNIVGPPAAFLEAPPIDVPVLLGFVRSKAHLEWVFSSHTYNLRASDRPGSVVLETDALGCNLLVLSCPATEAVVVARKAGAYYLQSESAMEASGYPGARGSYLCVPITIVSDPRVEQMLSVACIERLRLSRTSLAGAPTVVSWLEILMACSGRDSAGPLTPD